MEVEELVQALESEQERKAFWINLYNAEAQVLSGRHPVLRRTRVIYLLPLVRVAGKRISLQRIENGMLRNRTILGTRKPGFLTPGWEAKTRIREIDPRIHFALNCAAASCPPIRFYDPAKIDDQLELATESYLDSEVQVQDGIAEVPRVFKWYSEDFGGENGILRFLESYGFQAVELKFSPWSWEKETGKFA